MEQVGLFGLLFFDDDYLKCCALSVEGYSLTNMISQSLLNRKLYTNMLQRHARRPCNVMVVSALGFAADPYFRH